MALPSALKELAAIILLAASPAKAGDALPWIFLDFGKTLIDHNSGYTNMRYIPGARDYIKDLKNRGFHLGMLINWPEEEGGGDAEKLALCKQFVFDGWNDPAPFDWDLFDVVLFPPKNIYRKPHPYLFQKALRMAEPAAAVYQGEVPEEIAAAEKAGMAAHRVVFFPEAGEKQAGFLSADELIALARKR
jgi:phosphoglycolate phosphatase-like HAD superfamily hydrolase